jgi:flagellin-specific chaperone FliS
MSEPLVSTLPKEPSDLTREELLEQFYKLALRCFNSENALDMAKELIKNYEATIRELRDYNYDKTVKELMKAIEQTSSTATKES